jgi:hypothetical protein
VDVVDGPRLRGQLAGFDGDVLGGCPVTQWIGQPEHLVPNGDSSDPESERHDDARHLLAGK